MWLLTLDIILIYCVFDRPVILHNYCESNNSTILVDLNYIKNEKRHYTYMVKLFYQICFSTEYQIEISFQGFDKILLWEPSQIDSWFYIHPQKQITVRQQLHTSTVINNLIYHYVWQIWLDYTIHSFLIIWGTKVQEKC